MAIEAPTRINGCRVLESVFVPGDGVTRSGHIIIVEKPEDGFITSWTGVGDKGWNNGHYFEKHQRSEAFLDFWRRVAKSL